MLQAAADVLMQFRQRTAGNLEKLSQEQWFMQPDGFANNIAWNVGHLVMAQHGLCYGRLGVEGHFDADQAAAMQAMYGGGTSPADWDETPDTDELLRLFLEVPGHLSADIEAGKFDNYEMPEPVEGRFPPAPTVMHGFIFNQLHEGLHMGTIGELIGFMKNTG